jgi:hypothetical protein
VHVPAQRRKELLALFRESGLTRQEFAQREGIRYTTFCTWTQREEGNPGANGGATARPKQPGAECPKRINFAEVALPEGMAGGLEVRLPDGTTLRGGRADELAALARALRG